TGYVHHVFGVGSSARRVSALKGLSARVVVDGYRGPSRQLCVSWAIALGRRRPDGGERLGQVYQRRVVVVTGASAGVGRAIVRAFAARGARRSHRAGTAPPIFQPELSPSSSPTPWSLPPSMTGEPSQGRPGMESSSASSALRFPES